MAENNKIIWSEGMFLRPQHFQQHDRYLEALINGRCLGLRPFDWGFYSVKVDPDLLRIGKLSLSECSGIFPDGTPFSLPENGELPLPLDIAETVRNEEVFIALPLRRPQSVESDSDQNPESLARYRLNEKEVRDNNAGFDDKAPLQVGKLKTRLMLQQEDRSGYACLGIGRIIEVGDDKNILMDANYIPVNLNCAAIPRLTGFLRELNGLLSTRSEELAARATGVSDASTAQISDFLLLQLCNHYQPLFEHLSQVEGLHPEEFYRIAIQLAGDLSTFFRNERRPIAYGGYIHDNLQATFSDLMEDLRQLLGGVIERVAIRIPLKGPKYGVYLAKKPDLNLFRTAIFVLAVSADITDDQLRREFPPQIKIAPVENIQDYVKSHTPGIEIKPLNIIPRQLPIPSSFTCFQLNKHSKLWKILETSAGIAIHIGGDFPELQLELWAIRKG